MSNRAWMPLSIDDYMADTGHLTAAEHGAYLLLIMRYWKDGGLPSDERMIQRYSRLDASQWAESRDVLAAFFDDGWRHKRIDAEMAKADDIIEKRRSAANGRHGKSKQPASAVQVHSTSTDTGALPRTNNQTDASQAQHLVDAAGKVDFNVLESQLRQAAGLERDPSPGLMVFAPILGLLQSGHDLELDILPTIRAVALRSKRPARTWDYFTEAIRESAAQRRNVEARGHSPPPSGAVKGENIFEAMVRGERNGQAGNSAGDGAIIDVVPGIPRLERQDEPGYRKGLSDRH